MITLHTFGPQFGLPDPSPFVTKADVMLKISGVPYKTCVGNLRRAPKGKMPFIEDDGQVIGDSTLIRLHIEKKYGVDFDQHLTPVQRGTAWAVEKMLEDHLYWIIVQERWMDDANFAKGLKNFFNGVPGLIRPFIVSGVRRMVRKNLHAHGIGRHTKDEATALAARAIDSVAAVLGENTYLLGADKCGADATVFAFIVGVLSPYFTSPMRPFAERHANLTVYCDRMRREFYPS
jgi:glutathione S-transferase